MASVARFYGIDFGLPNTNCRPDEQRLVLIALQFLRGDLNPHFFNYPTLYMYILSGIFSGYFIVLALRGAWMQEFLTEIALHLPRFYLLSRGFSATMGGISVLIVYFLTRRFADKATALIAAGFMSIAYLHVRDSHFGTTDVTMTCFALGALLFLFIGYEQGRMQEYVLAGIFTGLATATKYGGVFLVVPVLFSRLIPVSKTAEMNNTRRPVGSLYEYPLLTHARQYMKRLICDRFLWLYGASAFLTFFLCSPFIAIHFPEFLADFLYETEHVVTRPTISTIRGWWFHGRYTLPYGLGWGIFVSGLLGMGASLKRAFRKTFILCAFPLVFYGVAGSGFRVYIRYMIPLVPFFCIGSALWIRTASRWKIFRRISAFLTPVLIGILAFQPMIRTVRCNYLLAQEDTRVIAARWVQENVPSFSTIYQSGSQYGHVQLPRPLTQLEQDLATLLRQGLNARLLKIQISAIRADSESRGYISWEFDETDKTWEQHTLPDYIFIVESPLIQYSQVPEPVTELVRTQYRLVKAFTGLKEHSSPHWYDQLDAFYVPFIGFTGIERPGPNLYFYQRCEYQKRH